MTQDGQGRALLLGGAALCSKPVAVWRTRVSQWERLGRLEDATNAARLPRERSEDVGPHGGS